ncbi:50S ribosomal protein L21 [Patescibacteria group bacterium]
MKYAIVKLLGQQHKVSVGQTIEVNNLDKKPGSTFIIEDVLMVVDGEKVSVGTPTLKDAVTAEVIEHKKGDKIRVATYKAKSRYRRVKGHRSHLTVVKITSIGKKPVAKPKKEAEKKTPAKKTTAKKA